MMDTKNRFGRGFATAVAIHLVFAVLISVFGYTFVTKPPQILEVTLAGGGGAPEEVVEEEVVEEEQPILQKIDDIIDQKKKPEPPKKKVVKKQPVAKNPGPPANTTNPNASGEGSGGGQGNGTGIASGDGNAPSGQGVPVTPPRVLSAPQPSYPSSARSQGVEGVTGIKMLVEADGKVSEAHIVKSSGSTVLDDAALKAVYKWRFAPAKDKFGQKARCYVTQGIRFDLRR